MAYQENSCIVPKTTIRRNLCSDRDVVYVANACRTAERLLQELRSDVSAH